MWKIAEGILLLCNLEEEKKTNKKNHPKHKKTNQNKKKLYSQVSSWKQDKGGNKTQADVLSWLDDLL